MISLVMVNKRAQIPNFFHHATLNCEKIFLLNLWDSNLSWIKNKMKPDFRHIN